MLIPGIESLPGVSGGEPCIVRTRIPVWALVQARRLGTNEADLLRAYPTLRAQDLTNAWAYYRTHRNETLALPVVEELRSPGHDLLTVQQAGKGHQSMPDSEVLRHAVEDRRIIVLLNRKHFIRLHNPVPGHAGTIVCTFDPDFMGLAHTIHQAIAQRKRLAGQLIRIQRPHTEG
jgi:uncharacterized protein (DUF433 family)